MIHLLGESILDLYVLIMAEGQRYGIDIAAVAEADPAFFTIRIEAGNEISKVYVKTDREKEITKEFIRLFFKEPVNIIGLPNSNVSLIIIFNSRKFKHLLSSDRGRISIAVAVVALLRRFNLN